MRQTVRIWAISVSAWLVSMIALALFMSSLPEVVPIHWGLDGRVNGTAPRETLFLYGSLPLLMPLAITLDSRRLSGRPDSERRAVAVSLWLGYAFMTAAVWGIALSAAGALAFDAKKAAFPLGGLAMVVVGNLLPRVRRNSFVGVRVPWIYGSDEAWDRTHRFAGKAFVATGFLVAACAALPSGADAAAFAFATAILVVSVTAKSIVEGARGRGRKP